MRGDFEEYRVKRGRDEEDSSEYQQSSVPSILGLGHEWIWQLNVFFPVSSLFSTYFLSSSSPSLDR